MRMAREAEVPIRGHYDEQGLTPQELERFAALVAASERDACKEICVDDGALGLAAAIRARGEE